LHAVLWVGLLLALLPCFPVVLLWLVGVSLLYPGVYTGLAVYLDLATRTRQHRT